jgi:hypothetical protein
LSQGSQTKYILGPSVPDPLGSVTFGLCGSVYFFADPDPAYSSQYYVNKLIIRSHTYIYFSLWSPVTFIGLYESFL